MSELQESASHLVIVGRGKVITETSVAELIATASPGKVAVRTSAPRDAATVLAGAGATVDAAGDDGISVTGMAPERIVALLGSARIPFSEVTAHRASLEDAYMELTRDAVEYRAEAGKAVR
jgi:ABC-2 type transport system ATP-binding protein